MTSARETRRTASGPPYDKPLPTMDGLAKEFYGWCERGELRFQRCSDCSAWRHVPRVMCGACGSFDWDWAPSSGHGVVSTWTVVARAMHPAFSQDVPYAAVVIEMDEGVRLISNVIDCPIEELQIGLPVEVEFHEAAPSVVLPKFRRASSEGATR